MKRIVTLLAIVAVAAAAWGGFVWWRERPVPVTP